MRTAITAGCLLALLGSGCQDLYEADPLHAAQADSSAAGFDVGAPMPARTADPPAGRSQPVRARGASTAQNAAVDPAADSASDSTPILAIRTPDSTDDTASGGPLHARPPGDSTHASAVDPAVGSDADVATLPAELSARTNDSVVVNTFLSYDPGARTVWVDLIAGFDGANGSLNFNGGFEGAHRLVVPVGWRVEARFLNRDRELSHSAIVVRAVDPIPMLAPPAAFPNAFTIALEDGILEGRGDVVRFSADTEGRYVLLCAVPGHGQNGMWIGLDVTGGTTVPEYTRR